MTLKILSWNIWISGYFDKVVKFIKNANADVIGLQEVLRDDQARDSIGFLRKLDYKYVYAPITKVWKGETWSDGPAIFSKYDIVNSKVYSLSKIDNRAAVKADIKVGDRIIHVYSAHLIHDHQKDSEIQKEQVKNLIKNLTRERAILMGDFNATPESQTIKKIKNVLIDSDSSSIPTWSVYPEGCKTCNPQEVNIRLDYIFTSKDVKVKSFNVENSRGSDHRPISAVIEI